MVLIIAALTVISTFLGGVFAIRFRDKLHLILGFSAGAVIAVAFFDLLPESIKLTSENYNLEMTALFIALGFTFYLLLDRFFSLQNYPNPSHRGRFGALTLSFHSFLDGFGIGMAFKVSPAVGAMVAAAVLTHDFSDGINTVNIILKNKGGREQAIRWLIVDALAPALGVVSTLFWTIPANTLGIVLAVFCGLFFYIGASDLIPESYHHHPTIWTTLMTILGMVIIYAMIQLAG